MSARPVVKTSHMPQAMQEFAIIAAQVNSSSMLFSMKFSYSIYYICRKQSQITQQNKILHQQSRQNLNNSTPQRKLLAQNLLVRIILMVGFTRWHCFIGRNFGCFVTHEASKFIYFYIGQTGICIFATA